MDGVQGRTGGGMGEKKAKGAGEAMNPIISYIGKAWSTGSIHRGLNEPNKSNVLFGCEKFLFVHSFVLHPLVYMVYPFQCVCMWVWVYVFSIFQYKH